jgi:3D-(3,5/4)-trihydroxycyclohexane-1,2-dione acylhydrolase (decyclizing)
VRFIAINVAELDALKAGALALVGDARATLDELRALLAGWEVTSAYRTRNADLRREWDDEVTRIVSPRNAAVLTQQEVIGHLNRFVARGDVIVCASGSLPGDLHRYWRAYEPGTYHLEYGYSCMGYEIAGGLGVSLATPDQQVYVLVGDGSYLMMAQEIVTAVQESIRLTIVLFDNHGFGSIGGLSESVGCQGFGTEYRRRSSSGTLDGDVLDVDFAANAASLGATVERASDAPSLQRALEAARAAGGVRVIVVPVDRTARSPGYDSWWDVPVAQVSTLPSVDAVRPAYEAGRARVRTLL